MLRQGAANRKPMFYHARQICKIKIISSHPAFYVCVIFRSFLLSR